MADPQIRSRVIADTAEFTAKVSHYSRGLMQPPHQHSSDQVSILLAGSVTENTVTSECRLGSAHVGCKAKGAVHSNCFGPQGALILCFTLKSEELAALVLDEEPISWRRVDDKQLSSLIAGSFRDDPLRLDRLWDQLAIAATRPIRAEVPEWLKWVRHQMEAEPASGSISGLADAAGVHRVHLSREFSRHFGLSPTLFRQKQMVAAVLDATLQHNVPPAIAAQEAGFTDQSHMIRTVKQVLGRGVQHILKRL